MANADVLRVLYAKKVSPLDFKWDTLMAPPLLSLITTQDIYNLNYIAMSNKLASKPQEKYKMIDSILTARGFKKIASGTNRITYKYLEDQSICVKVAIDRVGIKDNPAEFINQFKLKPFVTRVFEVSPCGTVGLFERVEPIVTREEFLHVSDDIFDLLVEKIIGRYVVQDVGSSFFQNYGVRLGFGPVLLDFPYVYELDGSKMYCNRLDPVTHEYCCGEIDYDIGFNNLVCTKCGKQYLARELEKQVENKNIIVSKKGVNQAMKIELVRGNEVVEVVETKEQSTTILPKKSALNIKVRNIDRYQKDQERKNKQKEAEKRRKEHEDKIREQKETEIGKVEKEPSHAEKERTIDIGEERDNDRLTHKLEIPPVVVADVCNQDQESEKESDSRCNQNISVSNYTPDINIPKKEEEPESNSDDTEEDGENESSVDEKEGSSWENPKAVEDLVIITDEQSETDNNIVGEY